MSARVVWLPVLALVFNAFTWGVSWWPFRHLEKQGLHPLWATALIYLLAVGFISLWRPASWRHLLRAPTLWVLVLASGTTNAAFNWAVTIGDVVRVVLLFYLMPLWAVLLARLLLRERLTPLAAARVALALAGAAIVLWPTGGGLPVPHNLAEALGVFGGFAFALNNVMLRHQAHQPEMARALAMFLGGTVVAGTREGVEDPCRPARIRCAGDLGQEPRLRGRERLDRRDGRAEDRLVVLPSPGPRLAPVEAIHADPIDVCVARVALGHGC